MLRSLHGNAQKQPLKENMGATSGAPQCLHRQRRSSMVTPLHSHGSDMRTRPAQRLQVYSNSISSTEFSTSHQERPLTGTQKRVVVVGGGWAGFGAAKHLAEQGYAVTLLEASKNPGGLSGGFRTSSGKVVEAGMKGFWYQYQNIFALLKELGGEWPLTDWTTRRYVSEVAHDLCFNLFHLEGSGFWSPQGLVTEAPVFSKLPRLPTLLGQFVHTAPLFWALPLEERLTMLPFLLSFIDFDASPEVYERYDNMSARELFRQWGVSQRCYQEFLRPTLLVGLFAPPEDISAAAMLETLYFYALAHQNDFDVCWPRGSIAETIFTPMVNRIQAAGGQVLGGQLVVDLQPGPDGRSIGTVVARDVATGSTTSYEADAVVFAIGITGMQKLVQQCRILGDRQEFRNIMNLRAIDVIATRLWFDRLVQTRYPANVLSGFEAAAGATFFNLNELQDEYKDSPGSVITADFYGASALLPLTDAEVVQRLKSHIETCEPGFKDAKVIDSAVLRFPKAVTHFSPGSYPSRPFQVTGIPNCFLAGDWVKGVSHGANGLSQERAYVTGLTAANLVIDKCGWGQKAMVLDVEADEPHIAALKQLDQTVRETFSSLGIKSPLL